MFSDDHNFKLAIRNYNSTEKHMDTIFAVFGNDFDFYLKWTSSCISEVWGINFNISAIINLLKWNTNLHFSKMVLNEKSLSGRK